MCVDGWNEVKMRPWEIPWRKEKMGEKGKMGKSLQVGIRSMREGEVEWEIVHFIFTERKKGVVAAEGEEVRKRGEEMVPQGDDDDDPNGRVGS